MSLKSRTIAINELLSEIYKRDMRLSYLLQELNFAGEDIRLIHQKLLPNAVALFLNILEQKTLRFHDGARQFKIIGCCYGLTGDRYTLRELGTQLNISHERVRQIRAKTIRKLSAKKNKLAWEAEYSRQIQNLLEEYNNCAVLGVEVAKPQPKYDFNPVLSPAGEKCLVISEGCDRITICQSDFQDFRRSLLENIRLIESNVDKIRRIKRKYSRAYDKWTAQEERWLRDYLEEGLEIKEIAKLLERQPSAISSRIRKLGLPYI